MTGPLSFKALESLVPSLLSLCEEAGAAICEHYHAPDADHYEAKGDDSPLTRADLASDAILALGLKQLSPELPILSEESSHIDVEERLGWPRYWLVDPLDGTKEFLARTGEFTINLALVDDHRPVLGVLFLPLTRMAYVGIPGSRAWRRDMASGEDVALHTRPLSVEQPLAVLASRRHKGRRLLACLDWLGERWPQLERHNSGSALKFCQLAEGTGDFYPRFSRCCEWDTAAGHAVLEAAGGALLGMDGEPLRYNLTESVYSPNFYGLGEPRHPLWRELLTAGDFR